MKQVLLQGFTLTLTNQTKNLWSLVFKPTPDKVFHNGYNRILALDTTSNADYIVGLVITCKDQNVVTEVNPGNGAGNWTLTKVNLDHDLAEFNFFVLNKRTHRGIYQFYQNSLKCQTFIDLLIRRFQENRDAYAETISNKTVQKNIRRCELDGALCVNQETFEKLVSDLKSIKYIDLKMNSIEDKEHFFTQTELSTLRRRDLRYMLQKDTAPSRVLGAISSMIPRAKKLRIHGRDQDNLDRIYNLDKNVCDFGRKDYNKVVELLPQSQEAIPNSGIVLWLLSVARESTFISQC